PYLRNPLAVIEREPSVDPEKRDIVVNERLLTDEEVECLERGDFAAFNNRIYLEADSGFGKSTFLLHLEHTLSRPNSGPLLPLRYGAGPKAWDERNQQPIFLPALSTLELASDLRALMHGPLLTATLLPLLPSNTPEATKHDWIDWCQRRNLFVFLFDALDQTTQELANLGTHLDSLPDSPAILSGRPRSQATQHAMFATIAWQPVYLKGLQVEQVQKYLGKERVEQHEDWFDDWDEPGHLWRPILEVPAVLRMIRELPIDQTANLKNREQVYAKTVQQLLTHGKRTLYSIQVKSDEKHEDYASVFQAIAWRTLFPQGDQAEPVFTGELSGKAYKQALNEAGVSREALRQVNFVTERSWLRGVDDNGLVWRHLSFCEYFAALHLLGLDPTERERILRQHGWRQKLGWVFAFALCASERLAEEQPSKQKVFDDLARDLIRFGRVFTVWNVIEHDYVELSPRWDQLCRWLVHRDGDGEGAWSADEPPAVDDTTLTVLADVMQREYRDSRVLHPAWELLTASKSSVANNIREYFLGEFARLVAAERQRARHEPGFDPQQSPVLQLVPEDDVLRVPELTPQACQALVKQNRNWRSCPPDPVNGPRTFIRGSDEQTDPRSQINERPAREIEITPFLILSGLVTNAQYERFDPSHSNFHDEYSSAPDQPVHNVSWYMAEMFTIWLTGLRSESERIVRLPTEAEWEFACRAGTTTPYAVGNGTELTAKDANFGRNRGATSTRGKYPANAWGIFDMHGNLLEWCGDCYSDDYYRASPQDDPIGPDAGSSRVLRGGSFFSGAVNCRSAYRFRLVPVDRYSRIGFRVALGRRSQLPSPSSL
ncbi:MAG: SUMF1/EgtB/PvdO family nonheme iron enzyme, partial [Planctomycetaceae bacterium]|nr:SUMF1/EgtB/PvdO family nonheme iron enzyme [Planctomycetaceae bacterium]